MTTELGAGLVGLFSDYLGVCGVQPGERVVAFTDPEFAFPSYASAAMAAAHGLGAEGMTIVVDSASGLDSGIVRETWQSADLVIGASSIPWIRTATNFDALQSGTRTVLVAEPPASLRRMFPDPAVIERTYSGARRLQRAREMRITDDHGSDLTMYKGERKVNAQCGVVDRPGRWDQWPSAMVDSTPIEDSAEGVLVAQPGDTLLRRYLAGPVTIEVTAGLISSISGGPEARDLQAYLDSFGDPEAFRLSHVGWGTDHRADWTHIVPGRPATWACPDQEGLLGVLTVAIGMNACDFPDEFSGLDGCNGTAAHIDISCRGKSIELDGEVVVDRERVVAAELLGTSGEDTLDAVGRTAARTD